MRTDYVLRIDAILSCASTTGRAVAEGELCQWWDQDLLGRARILVIGAGALGNEVLKNLALLGVGNVVVVDMDRIELSNLSRSVLFRACSEKAFKADKAAEAMRDIYPQMKVTALRENVLAQVGLGWFREADVVVGALDNREARVFVNKVCALLGKPWVDGGIEVLNGIVRGFRAPETACYECTMNARDWDQINQRRSCSLLARRALANSGTPTTPTTASIIGGIQAQEVVKLLHGLEALAGAGFFFDGTAHQSYPMRYQINPDCPNHEPTPTLLPLSQIHGATTFSQIAALARTRLGGLDAIDFSREMVQCLVCPACHGRRELWESIEMIDEDLAHCSLCGAESVPEFRHSLSPHDPLMSRTPQALGLPERDILWARFGLETVGIELAAVPSDTLSQGANQEQQ